MSKKKVVSLGEILPGVIRQIEKDKNPSKEMIESFWVKAAGAKALAHSRPASLRKSVLTVKVDSSAWLEELEFQKRNLLKALKRSLGKDRISEIRFKIGEF